ncbi:early growth response protein [Penicillium riverlandense]|uniref:early growth response protein n=1 Tax=Penicillium riverlandense TaxID=1903569 RepID=UPI002547218A|nr:early growth response protein [Penicillium riverlandense]KAJ5833638.1 early growth response protein [Penicillium riverlandense]
MHRRAPSEPSGERRRVAQACKPCNTSKLRCDGQRPCDRCRRYGDECYYEDRQKRRTTGRTPASKRHQPQAPGFEDSRPSHSYPEGCLQSTGNPSPPLTTVDQVAALRVEDLPPSEVPTNVPNLDGYVVGGAEQVPTQGTALNDERPSNLRFLKWENLLDLDLDIGAGLDSSVWPNLLDSRSSMDYFDNIWLASTEPNIGPNPIPETSQMPTPLTPATMAEIYNRACSPDPSDEAVEPRQYHPTAIEIDAQLTFPDMQQISMKDVDQEDLAHVHEIQQDVVDEVVKLATVLESKSLFPPFVKLNIPPAPIINAWTQLYFEHFHPVFPVLNKPTFGYPSTHWLLVFAVSAIGAQFSQMPQARTCARAMHEMIRRQSMYLVSPLFY